MHDEKLLCLCSVASTPSCQSGAILPTVLVKDTPHDRLTEHTEQDQSLILIGCMYSGGRFLLSGPAPGRVISVCFHCLHALQKGAFDRCWKCGLAPRGHSASGLMQLTAKTELCWWNVATEGCAGACMELFEHHFELLHLII